MAARGKENSVRKVRTLQGRPLRKSQQGRPWESATESRPPKVQTGKGETVV